LIVGDVIDLKCASVDVAQYEIGRSGAVDWGDARELPIQPDGSDEGVAGQLIVADVVDYQPAHSVVAQQQIGFARNTAEITDA
jgi:hypothetical protein